MAERVLTPGAIEDYAAATPITAPEVADLVAQLTTYSITQPGLATYYKLLKALAV